MEPQQLAAAARLSKGTIYNILSGRTQAPRYSTWQRICKVLQVDIATVLGAEQLDLIERDIQASGILGPLEQLLVAEIDRFDRKYVQQAGEIAVTSLLEVKLGMGRGPHEAFHRALRGKRSVAAVTQVVMDQLYEVPVALRLDAVRAALGALFDYGRMSGEGPDAEQTYALHQLRYRLWRGQKRRERRGTPSS